MYKSAGHSPHPSQPRPLNLSHGMTPELRHAEVEDALGADKGGQTTLSQYALTAPVVRRLGGLRSRNKRGKVA